MCTIGTENGLIESMIDVLTLNSENRDASVTSAETHRIDGPLTWPPHNIKPAIGHDLLLSFYSHAQWKFKLRKYPQHGPGEFTSSRARLCEGRWNLQFPGPF